MRRLITIAIMFLMVFSIDIVHNKIVAQLNLHITECTDVASVIALVDTVFLDGVNPGQYKNISFTGDPRAVGYFDGGHVFGFNRYQGIVMSSGFAGTLDEDNKCGSGAYSNGNTSGGSDVDLADIAGQSINDACIIEFDFMPTGDTARFNYVFGSEEYHDFVNTQWNDVFGFFLSGPGIQGDYTHHAINIAQVPGTSIAVSINNVNCGKQQTMCTPPPGSGNNCQFLYDNTNENNGSFYQTALDAFTVPFVADNETQSCAWYHIKLAIGDAGDANYDSGVFLEKGSFDPGTVVETTSYTHPTIDTILYESCNNHDAILYFGISSTRVAPYIIPYQILGSANSLDYALIHSGHEDTIYIAPGSLYDSIIIRPFWDDVTEGIEDIRIVYNPVMCGFSMPDTAIVLISDVPEFPDTNLIYNTYCEETVNVGFANILGGIPPYNYTWYEQGSPTAISNQAYIDYVITGKDNEYMYCVINDTCSYQSIDTAFVIVPDLDTDAGPDKSLCNMPSIDIEGLSPGAQNYNWISIPNDPTIIGQGNDTITVSPSETTKYVLVATDNCTNSDQDTAIVTLDGAIANASPDGNICLTGSISLSCNIGNSNETYIWTSIPNDPGLLAQSTMQTINVSPTLTTTYYVEVTDACNFQDTDAVEVVVFDLPNANAGNDNSICMGEDYSLLATGGVSYQWSSMPLDPSLAINQQDMLANPVVTPNTATVYEYYVDVTNQNGCTTSDTMELTVNNIPNISLSPDFDVICFGETVTITANGDIADDYSWTANPHDPSLTGLNASQIIVTPDTTTTYSLYATIGGIACPATPEYTITVIPQLFSSFEIANGKTLTCENEAVGIFYTGNATANAVYEWNFDADAIINSGSNNGPYSVQWTNEGTKTISLTLNENGCPSDTVEMNVEVIAVPTTDFKVDPEYGCAELEVNFTNLSSRFDDASFTWAVEGITSNDTNTIHTFTMPGSYPVSLTTTNKGICSTTESKNNAVTVYEIPTSEFDADPPETILEEGVINFINKSTSQDILTYLWNFGDPDSSTSTIVNPEFRYNSEGVFLVKLIATSNNGCQSEYSKTVTIHPDFALYPPNAFTPNGDGENDVFEIKGTGVSKYILRIYSRWGELIFESNSLDNKWDGTYNGKLVTSGTYIYQIGYRSMVEKDYNISGTVTVIR